MGPPNVNGLVTRGLANVLILEPAAIFRHLNEPASRGARMGFRYLPADRQKVGMQGRRDTEDLSQAGPPLLA